MSIFQSMLPLSCSYCHRVFLFLIKKRNSEQKEILECNFCFKRTEFNQYICIKKDSDKLFS